MRAPRSTGVQGGRPGPGHGAPPRAPVPVMRRFGEAFYFDPDLLVPVAEAHRQDFARAEPFPHVVIDGLFPEDLLQRVVAEFPEPFARTDWIRFDRSTSVKLAMPHDWTLGPATRHLLNQFNTAAFVDFLEHLTGVDGLLPDPHYEGGGLHQIERGGYLKVHADFNRHERLDLDRRLNALLYLNQGWRDEWGGQLELWDPAVTRCMRRISPLRNRLVVFATTDRSYHGHPEPLLCPAGTTRRSLALYYYTNGRPDHERSPAHNTLYRARPAERESWRRPFWKELLPPAAVRIGRHLKARGRHAGHGHRP